nr:disease resistance protein RGA2-like [Quercus suber]
MTELVSSVAEKVIEKLGSIVYQEVCLAWGVESDLKNLELTMSAIQAKLLDAEERQAKEHGLSLWLGELKDVLYDAVDVLDEFECEALRKQVVKTYGSTGKKVRRFFSCSNPLAFRLKMGHRMKEIRERLEGIKKLSDQFNLQERQLDDKHIVVRETHSFIPDSDVIGRDKDKQEIIDLLMQPGDDGNVSVIPIVGLGGMGKTTLAQSVYNDEMVKSNFHHRVWVCVSEDFEVKRLAKEILKSAGGEISENMSMDQVQANLRNVLNGKSFLIVLDDVWNEDRSEWNALKILLIEGAKGSKIIVTTRSHKVASVMTLGSIHELKGLPEQDCLCLFLKWAFEKGKDKQYPKLVEIGKDIVEKCRGVPLAVNTLGSLLYSKIEERDWISIRDNEIWKLEQKEKDILPALRLSYNKLPSYLKQCFAYCSLYPKDFRYSNENLIQCWMANGLLEKSNKSTEELENIGEQYLKELLSRSFFQEVHYRDQDNIRWSFKMHDLLHDLSLYVAQNDYCLIEDINNTNKFEKARHVSILDRLSTCAC